MISTATTDWQQLQQLQQQQQLMQTSTITITANTPTKQRQHQQQQQMTTNERLTGAECRDLLLCALAIVRNAHEQQLAALWHQCITAQLHQWIQLFEYVCV